MNANSKYSVSKLSFSITDDSRVETLGDASSSPDNKRRIEVVLYYPVDKNQDENALKAKYVSDGKKDAVASSMNLSPNALDIETGIYDALPFIKGERFPLLIFGHGYGCYAESSTMLFMDIVSEGYIVASVGHPYESAITEFEDGTFALFDKSTRKKQMGKINFKAVMAHKQLAQAKGDNQKAADVFENYQKNTSPFMMERVKEWAADNLCALEAIKTRFGEYLDLTHGVAASGHSFGGATAYSLCLTSSEISCGLNIDGGLFGDHQDQILNKPFYQISCVKNLTLVERLFTKRDAPLYVATFKNLKHIGLTDLKFLAPDHNTGSMKPSVMQQNLSACHIAFLNKYLKGMDVSMDTSTHKDVEIKYYF